MEFVLGKAYAPPPRKSSWKLKAGRNLRINTNRRAFLEQKVVEVLLFLSVLMTSRAKMRTNQSNESAGHLVEAGICQGV